MSGILLTLRQKARGVILPVEEIKKGLRAVRKDAPPSLPILDFGAGTLFWSNWFAGEFSARVCAVDPLFGRKRPDPKSPGISMFADLDGCVKGSSKFSFIWACDVFHHIPRDQTDIIMKRFSGLTDILVIKDIASESFRGNLQNRIHDLVFNRQIVRSISREGMAEECRKNGFADISVADMSHFGYSHFLLVARRKKVAR